MAVTARLFDFDGQLGVDLHLDEARERVRDDPPAPIRPESPWIFEWDAAALDERGQHEFLGLFTSRLVDVTDTDIDDLDTLPLPRVDYPPAGLRDASLSDLVRWARRRLLSGAIKPRSA
ncbi:MAG TPA: hypothetical protein VFH48_16140 [Chloroflexota bacterium]|nr:hypothetical protein [Chloroflexota bacterium]